MQEDWASEVRGAGSGGQARVRTRAANLVPSQDVASAAGTRQNLGRCHGKMPAGRGRALQAMLLLIFGVIILLLLSAQIGADRHEISLV